MKSPDNVPDGCSSLQFEIYESSKNTSKYKDVDLIENCLYAIEKLDISQRDKVIVTDLRTLTFGNVTFYEGMEKDRSLIRAWLEKKGIILAGRFGEWDYFWSNQAMISGFAAADKLLD